LDIVGFEDLATPFILVTNVSEEHTASIFMVEDQARQPAGIKYQAEYFLLASCWLRGMIFDPEGGGVRSSETSVNFTRLQSLKSYVKGRNHW
jgi:hypothetical protein